jgi:argininosuccinate lyase
MEKSTKLWGGGGRFGCGMNVNLSQLNNSLAIDKRLYAEDIKGSLAYAQILSEAKIICASELETIRSGFKIIQREWDNGDIELKDDDEDVHSVNERRLIEIVGDVGRKIHTGRSRNDQVAVDMKIWTKKAIQEVLDDVKCLLKVMIERADEKIHVIMPGYTHLQVNRLSMFML